MLIKLTLDSSLPIKLNLNTLLLVLGGLGVFAPDVAFVANWLNHWNVHWLTHVAHALGYVAAACAAAPLAVPKIRAFLALFKLATPAGEVVPHPPLKLVPKDPEATPPPSSKPTGHTDSEATPSSSNKQAGYIIPGRLLLLLGLALLFMIAWLLPKFAHAEGNTVAPAPVLVPATPVVPTASSPVPVVVPTSAPVLVPVAPPVVPVAPSVAAQPAPVVPVAAAPAASAYDSKYGACKRNFCLAPALAIQVFQYVPSTGDMVGGLAFAGGYGVVWHTIVDLGLAGYFSVQFSRDKPFTAQGLALFNVANYVSFGPGFQMLGQSSGPAIFHLTICFAANWIPGLTTSN
jgi:hypothetical protein